MVSVGMVWVGGVVVLERTGSGEERVDRFSFFQIWFSSFAFKYFDNRSSGKLESQLEILVSCKLFRSFF